MFLFRNKIILAATLATLGLGGVFLIATAGFEKAPEPQKHDAAAVESYRSGRTLLYTHPTYNFNFWYPDDYVIGYLPEENGGEQVLLQKDGTVLQIAVRELFDERISEVTEERLRADNPGIVIADPQQISVGGVFALRFSSRDAAGRPTVEVWFVREGILYEITGDPRFAFLLRELLEGWYWV